MIIRKFACAVCAVLLLAVAAQAQKTVAPPATNRKVPAPAPAQTLRPAAPISIDTPTIKFSGVPPAAPARPIDITTAEIKFSGVPPAGPAAPREITTAEIKFSGVPKR